MCFRKKVKETPAPQPQEETRQPEPRPVKVVYSKVQDGIIPAARPSQHVQLTPVVAPVTIVPYMSQEAPLVVYADDEEE